MKAVILAGGFATRLRPLSCTRPKTLFPIVNKPLLEWIFERLADSDVSEAILAINRLTEFYIKQYRVARHGLKIRYSHDPSKKPLGTAGPVKRAERFIDHDEPFLVLNGDIFADLNYRELVQTHKKRGALATIALCSVEDPSRYGVAELSENGRIERFTEKPPMESAPSNLINAGVYVLEPDVLALIPEGRAVSMEREIFPRLAKEGCLFGHCFKGLWMDIGKPEEYLQANRLILDSLSKNRKRKSKRKNEIKFNNPVAFGKGVSIGKKTIIGPYVVLGKNVRVGNETHIRDSIIFSEAVIEDSVSIEKAIVGEGAVIRKGARISRGCIIADHATVQNGICLEDNLSVCPAKEVTENMLKSKITS